MMTFRDRGLPESAGEKISLPSALVIWDMQEGIAPRADRYAYVRDHVSSLRQAAQACGVPVIFSQHFSLPLRYEATGYVTSFWRQSGRPDPETMRELIPFGSAKMQFVGGLEPSDQDVVLPKIRASFFYGTPLLAVLQACHVETLVLTGVATDRGILTTARDAALNGVFPLVVSDACGAFSAEDHARGLAAAASVGDVVSSDELLAAWKGRASVK